MIRSVSKGIFVCSSLLKKINKCKEAQKENKYYKIETYSRNSMIIPIMIGHTIGVHNGKKFINVEIKSEMLKHKLGEFASTRVIKANHKVDNKKGKK